MPKTFHPTWQPLPTTTARVHIVEIHTDEGIIGIGSGGVPVRWEVAGLFLMGQDPFNIEQHVYNLRSMAFFVGRPWPVEIALWDIIGKATRPAGVQAARRRQRQAEGLRLDRRAAAAPRRASRRRKQIVADGFKALKLRFHSRGLARRHQDAGRRCARRSATRST